jgi:hypothetical protein
MAKVKKIDILPFVKFQTIMGAIIGLILGIIYSFGGLIIDTLVSVGLVISSETPGLSYGTVLAFGALIGMPIIFLIFGFIIGLIEVFLFNLFARWIGAIKIDFERK